MKYIIVGVFVLFLTGCESKKDELKAQNSIENIIMDYAYVVLDNAKIMAQYRDFNQHLLDDFDIDFRTITTDSEEDIDLFSNHAFNTLQKESRSTSGKAILMVINPAQDKVRLEVSMALEPVYTDAFVSYIERKGFIPYFRNDTIADAIYMASELISDRAYDAQVEKEFMPPMQSKSIGAGAKTQAHIGKMNYHEKKGANVAASSYDTPIEVLKKYLESIKSYNTNPNLDIYTDATKRFFVQHTVTKINQDNEIQFLTPCMDSKEVKYDTDSVYAVVMNDPVEQRKCTPHFFKKEQGQWKLNIATMAQILRFNASMDWHFDEKERLKGEAMYYAFAFDGLTFDRYGYPQIPHSEQMAPEGARWGFDSSAAWYEPGPSRLEVKKHPEKYLKAMISRVFEGSYAAIRLGLRGGDYIHDIEIDGKLYKNVLNDEFLRLMGEVKKGSVVKLFVKNHKGKFLTRQGIAP